MEFKITLYGNPITKKNHIRVFKNVVLPAQAYLDYEKSCRQQMARMNLPHFENDIEITCNYYMKTRRKIDIHNLMQATADIIQDEYKTINRKRTLVKRWLIADDELIKSWDGSRIKGVDKLNPRVEIIIRNYKPRKGEIENE